MFNLARLWTIAVKDLRLFYRDKAAMFFVVGFPALLGIGFGLMMGEIGSGSSKISVAIVDEDTSPMSKKYIQSLNGGKNLEVVELTRDAATADVRKGKRSGMIVLTKGFGEKAGIFWGEPPVVGLGLDPSKTAEAGMLEGIVMQGMGPLIEARFRDPEGMKPVVDKMRQQLEEEKEIPPAMKQVLVSMMGSMDAFFASLKTVQDQSEKNNAENEPGQNQFGGMRLAKIESIDVTREEASNPSAVLKNVRSRWDISFPQSMMWGILACAAGFATLLVKEKAMGTHLRLEVSPVHKSEILAGKGLACFLMSLGVIGLMLILGLALNLTPAGGIHPRNWLYLGLAAPCIAFSFTGVMLIVSQMGKSEQAVNGAAWMANMFLAMFGGCMIPRVFLPPLMQKIGMVDPVNWAIYALEGSIWRPLSWGEMLLPCSVLIGFGLLLSAIGVALASWRGTATPRTTG